MAKRKASGGSGADAGKKLKVEAIGDDSDAAMEISNVELMRMLRSSSTPNSSKLDRAFQFVEYQKKGLITKGIPMTQFTSFLAGWIQSEIIASAKSKDKGESVATDARSWIILHWCLAGQGILHVYPGIFKGIDLVLRTMAMKNEKEDLCGFGEEEISSGDDNDELLVSVVGILELLLHSYDRTFRPQLLDWAVFSSSFFDAMVRGKIEKNFLVLKAGALIADGFGTFLKTLANPKAAFQAIVEKLLDSLLRLTGMLIGVKNACGMVETLRTEVTKVLDIGLFHTVQLEGFPDVCTSATKWLSDSQAQALERETSSHKLLFDKITKLRQDRSYTALKSLGELFRMFIQSFRSYTAAINSDIFGVRGQEELDSKEKHEGDSEGDSKSVRLADNQQEFLVFVELSLPLIQHLSEDRLEPQEKQYLVVAINNLFHVAREQHIYVPTRDIPTHGHFKFIKFYYCVLLDYARLLSANDDGGKIAAGGYREIVRGIGCVLDMEHRAAEDRVEDLWQILLSAAATIDRDAVHSEVMSVGCQMLKIASELRTLSSLPLLFSTIKSVRPINDVLLSHSKHALGIKCFLCNPVFLQELRRMIECMPAAQGPEIVNLVMKDALHTLQMASDTEEITESIVMAAGEIYAQILENLNVTSTNAYQIGVNIRRLVDSVVAEPLSDLLAKISKAKLRKRSALKAFFLLRLYLDCRMLHRQCISLMPPQKAEKASKEAHEVYMGSLDIDWVEMALELQNLSIFSWIGAAVKVPSVINEIIQVASFSSFYYLTDLLAIQRLSDLQSYIHSVEYFEAKFTTCYVEDPLMNGLAVDSADLQDVKSPEAAVRQLLQDFKAEAKDLVALLLDGGGIYSLKQVEERNANGNVEPWNGVVSTLSEKSIFSARWQLISRTSDLWSSYASRKGLTRCIIYALSTWEQNTEPSVQCSITREFLNDISVCESQRIQTVLLPSVWKVIKKLLNLKVDFKEFRNPSFKDFEISPSNVGLLPDSAVAKCISLFELIASFPWAHKDELDTMQCIFCVCYVERLLLNTLVKFTRDKLLCPLAKLFELFAVCRQSIQSFGVSRSQQIGYTASLFDIDLFRWLYRSIKVASVYASELENRNYVAAVTSLASVVKSSQRYMHLVFRQLLSSRSKCLLIKTSEAQIESVGANDLIEFVDCCAEQVCSDLMSENQQRKYSLLSSVSLGRSLICVAAGTLADLDKKCQDNKPKELRFLTNVPWIASLRKIEPRIVGLLLGSVGATPVDWSKSCLLDVFLGSEHIDMNALESESPFEDEQTDEDNDETENPPEDGENETDETGDNNNPQVEPAKEEGVQQEQISYLRALHASEKTGLDKLFTNEREQCEIMGELFMAMGGLVKLRSLYFSAYALKASSHSKTRVPLSIAALLPVLYYLLNETTSTIYVASEDRHKNFFWLLGGVKCMESVGLLLPSLQPSLPPDEYLKLLRMHIDLLGAVIWLQSSEYKQSSVVCSHFYGDLKAAVKDSFCALTKFAPIPQLLLALQTIQKGLCGRSEFGFGLRLGDYDDGRVGVSIAASAECLASVLEAVSGARRLKIIAKHSPRFITGLMNLFSHLQGPAVFCKSEQRQATTSSYSVILQSLEIITRIASRELIFPMKAAHVALALHCPVGILRQYKLLTDTKSKNDDRKLDTDLVLNIHMTSCKLLYSVLRHRKRESGRSIALLGESLRVLLYSLESSPEIVSLPTDTAVQCARWLRRIYEELGEQKETLGRYCINVLSDYLSVLSGTRPFGASLDREVDKELRPGVYALLTSSQDLQQLHAALGEGPLRTNLAMLRRDYEKSFKYTGKI